jgi:hypothetical protein
MQRHTALIPFEEEVLNILLVNDDGIFEKYVTGEVGLRSTRTLLLYVI